MWTSSDASYSQTVLWNKSFASTEGESIDRAGESRYIGIVRAGWGQPGKSFGKYRRRMAAARVNRMQDNPKRHCWISAPVNLRRVESRILGWRESTSELGLKTNTDHLFCAY